MLRGAQIDAVTKLLLDDRGRLPLGQRYTLACYGIPGGGGATLAIHVRAGDARRMRRRRDVGARAGQTWRRSTSTVSLQGPTFADRAAPRSGLTRSLARSSSPAPARPMTIAAAAAAAGRVHPPPHKPRRRQSLASAASASSSSAKRLCFRKPDVDPSNVLTTSRRGRSTAVLTTPPPSPLRPASTRPSRRSSRSPQGQPGRSARCRA